MSNIIDSIERRESSSSFLNKLQRFSNGNTAVEKNTPIVQPPMIQAPNSRRRTSMFDPIDPNELQKTLYLNQNNVSIYIYLNELS
jgi:hypothetical protein